ncbi:MAG TPA: tetraacyldisaccharide 4'-kinase [Planctomycetota bacterium]|jgi:tetraacyldisaccharide 4'-kinase|nr:tetraacyldisaccharide 4'-kinase [Planctomycetota bacterium]OQC22365.1 MAG: Tetraacyldisaccharide 4'-kinase [Planctomycetes bacterium ADurb.Bin069]HNR98829.1 tetraacyldisaccharide 4'-kinase [Planctomycetota bacterium]HNU26605.1 tetraacyldisaccharide 4'-kinase [Planctomycetota bacterium]HOE29185.1 tetraacyldisaccharide 4'-kinase [Planctomycetota bacterium]
MMTGARAPSGERLRAAEPPGAAPRAAGPLRAALAQAWRLGMRVDRALTRRRTLPRPVVSVGNISLGGTGKTPFVVYLARRLAAEGLRPAVLTRGYRSGGGGCDEPREIAEALPGVRVLVGRDRRRRAAAALAEPEPPGIFILDDGFQHWALHRDVDLVLIDATRPPEDDKVVPAGMLREDVRALGRAHAVVVTRADLVPAGVLSRVTGYVRASFPNLAVACAGEAVRAYTDLAGLPCARPAGPVAAACGIGNPGAFVARAAREGLSVAARAALGDHHRWRAKDAAAIEKHAAESGAGAVLTTAKDATKIDPRWTRMPWVVMAIETRILEGEAALWALIRARTGTARG